MEEFNDVDVKAVNRVIDYVMKYFQREYKPAPHNKHWRVPKDKLTRIRFKYQPIKDNLPTISYGCLGIFARYPDGRNEYYPDPDKWKIPKPTKERSIMAPEQELVLREFAEGIQRAVTEGLEQALYPPALTWQVDQPKPMRNMTVEEIWWSKGHCKFRISSNCLIDMHNGRNGCHNCILIDRNSKTPSDPHWQAPQVPLNFTVEG